MSAHTAIIVSRENARMYLIRQVMRMSDDGLAASLDRALEQRLYTVRIVDEGPDDDLLSYGG